MEWTPELKKVLRKSLEVNCPDIPFNTVLKCSAILDLIACRGDYGVYGGKRLRGTDVISIPVGYKYRLLLREVEEDVIVPWKLITHQEYDNSISTRWSRKRKKTEKR
jgi:hypothetical protein